LRFSQFYTVLNIKDRFRSGFPNVHMNRSVIVAVKPESETIFFKDNRHGRNILEATSEGDIFLRTSAITDHHLLSAPKPAPQATCRKCRRHGGSVHGPVRGFFFVVRSRFPSRLRWCSHRAAVASRGGRNAGDHIEPGLWNIFAVACYLLTIRNTKKQTS